MACEYALEGIRILDLSQLIAGPSATSMLAESGADVIKVESLNGDLSRKLGQARKHGFSATFAAYNKGKRSIALDLKSQDGVAVARRLIANCDVLIEAFRPGVMDRFGLSYDEVSKLRPEIIYLSFSGFGAAGPMAERPGVDLLVQGESGIMSITGETDGPPMKIGFTAVDAAAGFALSSAILTGLVRRLRTGRGSQLRMSLLDVALYMQAGPLTDFLMSGIEPRRTGNSASLGSPAETFNTQDGTLIISAYFPNQWPDLCHILELDALIEDPSFLNNELRIENRAALHLLLQERFARKTSAEWKKLLERTRIIFGDALSYSQVVSHPQVRHNESLIGIESGQGALESVAAPLKIDGLAPRRLNLPTLGEQGGEILAELGYKPEEIEDLRRRHVFLN